MGPFLRVYRAARPRGARPNGCVALFQGGWHRAGAVPFPRSYRPTRNPLQHRLQDTDRTTQVVRVVQRRLIRQDKSARRRIQRAISPVRMQTCLSVDSFTGGFSPLKYCRAESLSLHRRHRQQSPGRGRNIARQDRASQTSSATAANPAPKRSDICATSTRSPGATPSLPCWAAP